MIKGLGNFTCDLYQRLAKNQNIFFSGYSISSALALAYLGARGETKAQMEKAMGYVPDATEAIKVLIDLGTSLNTADGKIETKVGNAIWVQNDLKLTQEFLAATMEVSDFIRKVDYKNAVEGARVEINKWIAEKTNNLIKDLIPEKALTNLTRLVLTNAIYFNGKWSNQFDPKLTREEEFHNLGGSTSQVELMYMNKTKCRYYEDWGFQFMALPYGDGTAELLVVLPKPDCFDAIDKLVTYPQLIKMSSSAKNKEKVKLWLPKFKLQYKNDIASTLSETMPKAFSNADFSGITGNKDLFISNIIHEAVVDVTEEGTEAAAATAVVMRLKCLIPSDPIMKVDRPFIFAIWDARNNVPMFMGRVVKL